MARSTKDDTLNALPSFSSCFSLAPWRAKPALVGGKHHWSPHAIQPTWGAPMAASPPTQPGELLGSARAEFTHLRKLQARQGDRQCRTHVGMLKTEQKLGSRAVGPPPLIMITLCTRSGYSCARNVQKETLPGGWVGLKGDGQQSTGSEGVNVHTLPQRQVLDKVLPLGSVGIGRGRGMGEAF